MITHILAAIKTCKLLSAFVVIGLAGLAAGEASSNRTLIIISAITSGTSLFGVLISGAISLHNSREARTIREKLVPLSELPQKVDEFRKEVDGRMTELRESRLETSEAKQEVARAEGVAQERTEERDRVAGATTPEAQKVEMVNPPENPANVRTVKGKT